MGDTAAPPGLQSNVSSQPLVETRGYSPESLRDS